MIVSKTRIQHRHSKSNVLHNVVAKDETKIIDEMKVQTMYKMIEEITIKTDLGHKVITPTQGN